jgi:hypothetical protein
MQPKLAATPILRSERQLQQFHQLHQHCGTPACNGILSSSNIDVKSQKPDRPGSRVQLIGLLMPGRDKGSRLQRCQGERHQRD